MFDASHQSAGIASIDHPETVVCGTTVYRDRICLEEERLSYLENLKKSRTNFQLGVDPIVDPEFIFRLFIDGRMGQISRFFELDFSEFVLNSK